MDDTREDGINLNAATVRELTQLPRIGVDRARKIVRCRAMRRGFRDWADFARTLGLTEEDVEAIRTRARIGPLPDGGPATADSLHRIRSRSPVRRPQRHTP